MFQLVEPCELREGHKYKIVPWKEYDAEGNYIYKVKKGMFIDLYVFEKDGFETYFTKRDQFYKFVSKKKIIQSDMERRAINLIVRNLIGDDCFTW